MKILFTLCFVILLMVSACSGQGDDPAKNEDPPRKDVIQENQNDRKPDGADKNDNASNENANNPSDKKNRQEDLSALKLDNTITVDESGQEIVTNPNDILVVANKERNLPDDYVPSDLIVPNVPFPYEDDVPKKQMREEAAKALEQLFKQAEADGIQLFAQSGYRSYETQEAIFAYKAKQRGEEEANKVSAHPGQSEHQTGLSMDVTSPSVEYKLVEAFAETEEGKWLKAHAHQFGFIIRYPKDKVNITGYSYEPWHIRYVGIEHAKAINENGLALEEYLG